MTETEKACDKVRAWRKENGLSQTDLAAKLEVTQPLLSAFESGLKPLGEFSALKLQEVTNGAVKALECVSEDKKDRLEELLRLSGIATNESKGAA